MRKAVRILSALVGTGVIAACIVAWWGWGMLIVATVIFAMFLVSVNMDLEDYWAHETFNPEKKGVLVIRFGWEIAPRETG